MSYKGAILIVDDEPTNLELLFRILTYRNYEVRVANSGKRALAAVQASLPDLIMLDINMPEMDGYEVCRLLKSNHVSENIPVIFISAHHDTIDKVQAFAVGGVDYVTKPFRIEEVIARIETQLKIAHLSRQLQMQMLRYQLDPHFLFNALISVRALIYENVESADRMISQLSEYLRYLLASRNSLEIPLREEVEAAKNYLAIESIRYEDRLQLSVEVDVSDENYLIPAFLLQPLLENAVKYGIKTSGKPLIVKLKITQESSGFVMLVANTGHWLENAQTSELHTSPSLGVGLQNIRWRLKQLFPNNQCFEIKESDGWVNVTITIPANTNR